MAGPLLPRSSQPSLGSRPWQWQLRPLPPCLAGSPDCSLLLSLPAPQSIHLSVCLHFLLCVPVLRCCGLTLDLALPCPPRPSPGLSAPSSRRRPVLSLELPATQPGVPVLQPLSVQQVRFFQTPARACAKPSVRAPADPAPGGGDPAGARTAAPGSTSPAPHSRTRRKGVTQQVLCSLGLSHQALRAEGGLRELWNKKGQEVDLKSFLGLN